MKAYLIFALILIGISLFCGIVVISIGIGSLFPQINQIAKPIVCGSDVMEVKQHVYHYRPGETSWTINAYCVDSTTGVKKDVTGLVQLVAGMIYSVIPLITLIILSIIFRDKGDKTQNEYVSSPGLGSVQPYEHTESNGMKEKLEKLKQLRESNLITEEDYQKKKDEILSRM
jgi:hypothetical protein